MRLIRVDTGYRHALGDRYHLLILCLRYGANWYDWQPLQASASDRHQRFSRRVSASVWVGEIGSALHKYIGDWDREAARPLVEYSI